MIIWVLALVLLALLATIGYFQGAIRVAISLAGLFIAALLALPLSGLVRPVLPIVGFDHPFWAPFLPPVIVFFLVLIAFKIAAYTVHQKVAVHYKYKTDDKTALKWERLNSRLGLTLGFVNGAVYFVLILVPIYVAGYLTTQVATGAEDAGRIKLINNLRDEMHESKADKVVAAYNPAPTNYYVAADIVGVLKNNPLLNSRLARYPVFLALAERKEFQDMANDIELNNMIQAQARVGDIVAHPKVQAVITNVTLVAEIEKLVGTDLPDLHSYLLTGKSEKYDDEKILGRWVVNLDETVRQEKVANPRVTPVEMMRLKGTKYAPMRGVTLTALTDGKAILKSPARNEGESATVLAEGSWKSTGGGYDITFGDKTVSAIFEEGRLLVPNNDMTLVLEKEI